MMKTQRDHAMFCVPSVACSLHRIAISLLLFMAAVAGAATADSGSDLADMARRKLNRKSAEIALQRRTQASHVLRLESAMVREAVEADLAGHRVFDSGMAEQTLRKLAWSRFEADITEIAGQFEAERSLFHDWLRNASATPSPIDGRTPREQVERHLSDDLGKQEGSVFMAVYQQARLAIGREQFAEVRTILMEEPELLPDAIAIVGLAKTERNDGQRTALVDAVMATIADETKRLLDEANANVRGLISGAIKLGEAEYFRQVRFLGNVATEAWTPAGIRAELCAQAEAEFAAANGVDTDGTELQRHYGSFLSYDTELADTEVRRRFAQRLRTVIDPYIPTIDDGLETDITRSVSADPVRHHTVAATLEAYADRFRERMLAGVADAYISGARAAKSEYDAVEHVDALTIAAGKELTSPVSMCRDIWRRKEAEGLEGLEKRLTEVRDRIAREQIRKRCPALLSGEWKPALTDAQSIKGRHPTYEEILGIPGVWADAPKTRTVMIEEAWELILDMAIQRIETVRRAFSRQSAIVDKLEARLTERIGDAPHFGVLHWLGVYTEEVRASWEAQAARDPVATAYPALFEETVERMRGIVDKAIGSEILEAQMKIAAIRKEDIRRRVGEELKAGRISTFDPHYDRFLALVHEDWRQHPLFEKEPELLDETKVSMRGMVQELVDAQRKLLDELVEAARSNARRESREDPADGETVDLKRISDALSVADNIPELKTEIENALPQLRVDAIESLQHRVVDGVKPKMAVRVADDYRSGREPTPETVSTGFREMVSTRWVRDYQDKADVLGTDWQKLRQSVIERIDGLVAELLKTERMELRKRVLIRQGELVTARQPEIQTVIREDAAAGKVVAQFRKEYVARYAKLVEQDWRLEEPSKIPGFMSLLTETNERIGGIVDKVLVETRMADTVPPKQTAGKEHSIPRPQVPGGQDFHADISGDSGQDSGSGNTGGGGGGTGGTGGMAGGGPGADKGMGIKHGEEGIQRPENLVFVTLWFLLAILLGLAVSVAFFTGRLTHGAQRRVAQAIPRSGGVGVLTDKVFEHAHKCAASAQDMHTLEEIKLAVQLALADLKGHLGPPGTGGASPNLETESEWLVAGAVLMQHEKGAWARVRASKSS